MGAEADAVPDHDLDPIDPSSDVMANYGRFPLRFVRGEGCWLEDDRGRRFLDALAGIAVNSLGHAHPELTAAIRDQAGALLHTSNLFHIAPQERLAELICTHSFAERVFFCNSGAEANEAAWKLVRRYHHETCGGSKPRVLAAEDAFHGRTSAALSLTGTPAYHRGFEPLFDVDFVPYGDAAALEAAIGDDVAGVWLEPVQGEGGVVVPPDGYLARARKLCDRHRALLVFDEVQTGVGRCGAVFAHQRFDVVPDAMCLAKGLAGGVPIGALATTDELAALLPPGTHASTFGGNHLACAAGSVVMETVAAEGFCAGVIETGFALGAEIEAACGPATTGVRGLGLLLGAPLVDERPVRDLVLACLRRGLVVGPAGGNVLRFAPPLIFGDAEVAALGTRLRAAIADTTP